ncbi:GntR family transcriptional regulator [Streptomyces sulphureus]|uniref:GntR family transcriptional regulator n=1 Tax=Streptomyces sulphureus TaxID=47758 RepID=UPI0003A6BE4C|nr:GntR family transcriptional regulator [Streptomyces sulphureus]
MPQQSEPRDSTAKHPRRSSRVPLATLAEQQLKKEILNGDLLPGAALVEAEITDRMDMSKTPVREALRLLARSGLVSSDSFRTWRVRRLSDQEARDIFEIRSVLASRAAEKACTVADEQRHRRLRTLIDETKKLVSQGAHAELSTANRELHAELAADCGNEEVIRLLASYDDILCLAIVQGWRRLDTSEKEFHEHCAIVEAFIERDAQHVGELMRQHISGFAHHFPARHR